MSHISPGIVYIYAIASQINNMVLIMPLFLDLWALRYYQLWYRIPIKLSTASVLLNILGVID